LKGASKNPHFIPTGGTTDMTTSHLTNPAKDTGQVIGYSHSTKLPKNGNQVAGYAVLRKKFLAYISVICGAAKWGKQAIRVADARKFFHVLLTIPHGLLLPVADRRPLVGHLGEL
jgi:hypothetical protein